MTGSVPVAWLEGSGPATRGRRFDLGLESVRIGRGSACQLALSDPMVSREHAEIRHQADGFAIVDLGSTHGTFVDDQRVQEAWLRDGVRIRLGESEFVFRLAEDAIPTAMVGSVSSPPPTPSRPDFPRPASAKPPPAVPPSPTAGTPIAAPPKQRAVSRWLVGCGVAAALAVCGCVGLYVAAVLAESSGGLLARLKGVAPEGNSYTAEDLRLALAVPVVDERPAILENLGRPDEFDISVVQVEGGQVRLESWRYYGLGTRVDFTDGVIVWTIDLEPGTAGTFFPAWYDPTQFETDMTIEEATALLTAASPAGTVPERIGLSEGGEDLAGVELLVGDQITVGFEDGKLVYVESIGVTMQEGGG
jgi:hypothetical protein